MFTSKEWQSSQFVKTRDGEFLENLILDKGFWKYNLNCMRGCSSHAPKDIENNTLTCTQNQKSITTVGIIW